MCFYVFADAGKRDIILHMNYQKMPKDLKLDLVELVSNLVCDFYSRDEKENEEREGQYKAKKERKGK